MINQDNLRGAGMMVLAMAAFALEDTLIKLMAARLPTWEIVALLSLGGAAIFAILARRQGQALWRRDFLSRGLVVRNLAEITGIVGFVTALSLIEISLASAILQSAPLIVTLGAALFLGEPVGWRRWSAILVGFLGVLIVLRPGAAAFDGNALFAVVGVIGLAVRDLATRAIPAGVSSMQVSYLAFVAGLPAAAGLAVVTGAPPVWPGPGLAGLLAATVLVGAAAYYLIVSAMRLGDVSFVAPFRYSRMAFALTLGLFVFGERPDAAMLAGTGLIVGSGLFMLWREQRLARR